MGSVSLPATCPSLPHGVLNQPYLHTRTHLPHICLCVCLPRTFTYAHTRAHTHDAPHGLWLDVDLSSATGCLLWLLRTPVKRGVMPFATLPHNPHSQHYAHLPATLPRLRTPSPAVPCPFATFLAELHSRPIVGGQTSATQFQVDPALPTGNTLVPYPPCHNLHPLSNQLRHRDLGRQAGGRRWVHRTHLPTAHARQYSHARTLHLLSLLSSVLA